MSRALLLSLPLLSACPDPGLRLIVQEQPEALLSVRGAADDVWMVGSDAGSGPLVLHADGGSIERIDTSALAGTDLWWVHPEEDVVVAVGSGGAIVEYDRAEASWTRVASVGDDVTMFGVWGPPGGALWAVGGEVGGQAAPSLWTRSGGTWEVWPEPVLTPGRLLFKTHGTGPDDRWIVGNRGAALHWDGVTLTETDTGTTDDLLTVEVGAGGTWAVGGLGQGVALQWEDGAWTADSPEFAPPLLGVCHGADRLSVVGSSGEIDGRIDDTWQRPEQLPTLWGLHGCLIDDEGALWAVGGSIASLPLEQGVVVYDGARDYAWP